MFNAGRLVRQLWYGRNWQSCRQNYH